ncbi:MAG: hypothetical protein KME23_14830 [Goleter apudmare HA4340-LM2]|jgi:archaellum biogenesis ATPase FlaH|nr:hypothetical protein [Goleter apudmare HA4340-LM2]
MVAERPAENLINQERSWKTLVRSLTFSQGEFSLVAVCCNDDTLRQELCQRLQQLAQQKQYQMREIVLAETVTTLYSTIQEQLGDEQPSVLMISGLEKVTKLEDLLGATNIVRDEFRKKLSFPVVLWVNDQILPQILRLAPDFTSWMATPIRFDQVAIAYNFIANNSRALRNLTRSIGLSHGQFSIVLVCCNYRILREQMLQQIETAFSPTSPIKKLVLPHDVTSLESIIQIEIADDYPSSVMVLGLENVATLDDLLISINQLRDEFPKRLPFPLVLWVNEEVLQKIVRLAPDFASWAATPIRFEMTSEDLLRFLQQETDLLFTKILTLAAAPYPREKSIGFPMHIGQVWENSHEMLSAIQELTRLDINLEPQLSADLKFVLEFVFGLRSYLEDQIYQALSHFQRSLQSWQIRESENLPTASPHFLRQGILLFYLGLCHRRLGGYNQTENRQHCYTAKTYFQQCQHVFRVAGRLDIVAQLICESEEVLQYLQEWEELQKVAAESLELHQTYNQTYSSYIQIAYDYGFLAEVAMQQLQWKKVSEFAQLALEKLSEAQNYNNPHQCLFPSLLVQIYRLFLVQAQQNLGDIATANAHLAQATQELEAALASSDDQYSAHHDVHNAHRYIRLLKTLRSLYFTAGAYLEAFTIKQQQDSLEQQYGLRAFVGARRLQPQRQPTNPESPFGGGSIALEIAASGRERDVNQLIGRISRADQKLIVIHGPSGVGKSSTVTAGLVPALQNRAIGDQIAVTVVLQVYTDWVRELGKSLSAAIAHIKLGVGIDAEPQPSIPHTITEILQQLSTNANRHLITVLIFDQFEEFFFSYPHNQQQQLIDEFLSQCLNIPFVKVILSLREDYLHRLLEFKYLNHLEVINSNILDKNIRYQLKNFSPADAKNLIYNLTQRSQFYLETALIDALVEDLSAEIGEVRPIELQVVGVQLQHEGITTLEQYQPYRPNKLIERYIQEIIKDCGTENASLALIVLYLLTDENQQRPFKTRAELTAELAELEDPCKLELVLEILIRSGLVLVFPDIPERYQLIHDYLVDLIRFLQQQESSLQFQINQLRRKVEQSQSEINRLNSELWQKKRQNLPEATIFQPPTAQNILMELRRLRQQEELSQLEIEHLRFELKEKELTAQLAASQARQRRMAIRLNRGLKIALLVAVLAISGLIFLIFTTYLQTDCRGTAANTSRCIK